MFVICVRPRMIDTLRVPRGSFQAPRYADAEPRESMELRALVVY
jgi:hypothetical protein